jgi:hypothetical protein
MGLTGKPMLHLLPPGPLADVARVLAFGAEKHRGPWSWTDGQRNWTDDFDAAQRHMSAWLIGDRFDPESGLPHLAHASARLLILGETERSGKGLDNRPRGLLSSPSGD